RSLLVESDGSVWGSTWEGLVRWKEEERRTLTSASGLPCDQIYTLVHDDPGNLWLYAKCGVIEITRTQLDEWWKNPNHRIVPTTFDVFDGAQSAPAPLQP